MKKMISLFAVLLLAAPVACGTETTNNTPATNNSAAPGGKGDNPNDGACSLADSDERSVAEFDNNGVTQQRCRGPLGQFVEDACCPELSGDAAFTDDELECLCFEQSYNECLLGVTDGDFEPCTKMIDDTLLDDNCCADHGDLVSVLCNFEPDETTGSQRLEETLAPLCAAPEPTPNSTNTNNNAVDPVEEERLECLCFDVDYNECLLSVTDGDFEPCTKMTDDTLLDDDCCENFSDEMKTLCDSFPDESSAVEGLTEERSDLGCGF